MARPPKERRVEYIPEIRYFKPAGIPARDIKEVNLSIEEVEAIRLKDLEGLTQEECARKMEVSRPTFQRVLTGAREKIARALIEGKALRFEGGDYKLAKLHVKCHRCGNKFEVPFHHRHRFSRRFCPECDDEKNEE
ncbi:DUF134 domain-containing protein [Halothermothrix orenii]|uniref:UPF0251 protein Hore_18270 n=1 Tax=Halothermothrix orenii (strain H 168 / OCM 544 / DSM 9562) TaxID=373903 RepID=Y1827_HALOH|nr:DUF134 domain-containing protein [Halothermothrix orenii]B8CZ57.1 RecName: Full=UPF0251 protein Hore_18270 [Halothermothrix orenii H 168]ACL70576.1 predicted DNA-binding protein [Halothermothrix orenii H 168]